MSPKKWSKNTFGWARAEVLGALVNAVFLVALCFSITIEAIKRYVSGRDASSVCVCVCNCALIGLSAMQRKWATTTAIQHHIIIHRRSLTCIIIAMLRAWKASIHFNYWHSH